MLTFVNWFYYFVTVREQRLKSVTERYYNVQYISIRIMNTRDYVLHTCFLKIVIYNSVSNYVVRDSYR